MDTGCAHCYWNVTVPRSSQWTELHTYIDVYTHVCINIYFSLYLNILKIPPILLLSSNITGFILFFSLFTLRNFFFLLFDYFSFMCSVVRCSHHPFLGRCPSPNLSFIVLAISDSGQWVSLEKYNCEVLNFCFYNWIWYVSIYCYSFWCSSYHYL